MKPTTTLETASLSMEKCDKMYNSICRVCLKQSKVESMVSLEEKPGRRSLITFSKVLVKLARISIDYDDILPTKICQNCKQMIQNINSFKLMCKNNDRKLRKFINLAQNDSGKYKEMICEYTMFCQYFPIEGFKTTRSSPATASFQKKIDKIKAKKEKLSLVHLKSENEHESEGDYSYNIPFDDKKIEPSNDTENVDLFLDSIEKAVKSQMKHKFPLQNKQKSNIKNIDLMLESIEKAVNTRIKYSNTEKNTKPLHVPSKNFHCDICNRTLANRPNYNYHMQRHTKYRYICDQCGRGFPGKVPLHRHLVKNHDKGPSLPCKYCPFKCSKRFDLVEHNRIHTGERPFKCDKCGLTFRRKAIWRNHLIQHTEKTVTCNICQKKFHRQCELTWHINSAHERAFLYVCSVCNATYATNKTVRRHMIAKHGIPRDKQGKITRIAKDPNMGSRNGNAILQLPSV